MKDPNQVTALKVRFACGAVGDPSLHDQSMTDFDACFRESWYTVARPSLGFHFPAAEVCTVCKNVLEVSVLSSVKLYIGCISIISE